MYATRRRQRNFRRQREPVARQATTNPSKRHRERLNGELETVAALLPYDQNVVTRLDKLSVLRLAVSYLQVKTHFQVCVQRHYMHGTYGHSLAGQVYTCPKAYMTSPYAPPVDRMHGNEANVFRGLCGFVLILNENGEIYYASDNIETYLGFHQSDILHQPVFDMIHSEDREEIRQQLMWNYGLPSQASWQEVFAADGTPQLERSAQARFRCLLDNTCGFLRIDIQGRLMPLHGLPATYMNARTTDTALPVLGMVAVCSPFVPPPSLDGPDTAENHLKTKYSLDLALYSVDAKMRHLLEIDDKQLPISFYQLIHPTDTQCLAEAHKEVIKNGAAGLIVSRVVSYVHHRVYWLQSNYRLLYKNGKADTIACSHRLLTETEGSSLLEKRGSLAAKLLTFDDSLLQSPKLLQSTAAMMGVGDGQSSEEPSIMSTEGDTTGIGRLRSLVIPSSTTTSKSRECLSSVSSMENAGLVAPHHHVHATHQAATNALAELAMPHSSTGALYGLSGFTTTNTASSACPSSWMSHTTADGDMTMASGVPPLVRMVADEPPPPLTEHQLNQYPLAYGTRFNLPYAAACANKMSPAYPTAPYHAGRRPKNCSTPIYSAYPSTPTMFAPYDWADAALRPPYYSNPMDVAQANATESALAASLLLSKTSALLHCATTLDDNPNMSMAEALTNSLLG